MSGKFDKWQDVPAIVYGPMSAEAERQFRSAGYTVINPVRAAKQNPKGEST